VRSTSPNRREGGSFACQSSRCEQIATRLFSRPSKLTMILLLPWSSMNSRTIYIRGREQRIACLGTNDLFDGKSRRCMGSPSHFQDFQHWPPFMCPINDMLSLHSSTNDVPGIAMRTPRLARDTERRAARPEHSSSRYRVTKCQYECPAVSD
jgi:hypothetical protein